MSVGQGFRGGADGRSFRPGQPFLTLARAQEAVRARLRHPQAHDIDVFIREGTYRLVTPLEFRTQDSGRDGYRVVYRNYPGERPQISGGEPLTDWQPYDENIYMTTVNWPFGTLYENDVRGVLARYPNQDLGNGIPSGNVYIHSAGAVEGREWEAFYFDPSDFPVMDDTRQLEIHLWNGGEPGFLHWGTSVGLIDVDYDNNLIEVGFEISNDWYNVLGAGTDYYVQNSIDLLDAPGEFYLDGTTLYYYPRQLPIKDQTIVAPRVRQLFYIHGERADRLVHDVAFVGLELSDTDRETDRWPQANASASFFVNNVRDITISSNHLYNVGGHGVLGWGNTVQALEISNNLFEHMGYTAIFFDGWDGTGEFNGRHVIDNNHIHHTGEVHGSGYGIRIACSPDNRLVHNLMHDIPNAAIGIGGTGQFGNTTAANHYIGFNDIYHVTLDYQDMGLIYLGYTGPNNVIDNNYIHHSDVPFSYGEGIYLDEGAYGTTIRNNVIAHLQEEGGGHIFGVVEAGDVETVIDNNIFANNNAAMHGVIHPREYDLTTEDEPDRAADTPPNDIDVTHNIFYNNTGALYAFKWNVEEQWLRQADYNLFFNDSDRYLVTGLEGAHDLTTWRANGGFDQHSIVANPIFMDPENDDYRLRFDSPAYPILFRDINFVDIGLRPDFPFPDPSGRLDRLFVTSSLGGHSASLIFGAGRETQLELTARSEAGYVMDLGDLTVTYHSDDPDVATVDDQGVVTARGDGATRIVVTASDGERERSLALYALVGPKRRAAWTHIPDPPEPMGFPYLSTLLDVDFETPYNSFAFFPSPYEWRVVEESGNRFLCEETLESGSVAFGSVEWEDYAFEARLLIVGSGTGSLQTRFHPTLDTWPGYIHNFDVRTQQVSQGYCYLGGCSDWWSSGTASITEGVWFTVRAEVEGDEVRTFVNDRLVVSQTRNESDFGYVSVGTSPNTQVCVDDIRIYSLER